MASDELRIILEDVKEKFDIVIETVNMTNERLDRHENTEEERSSRLETKILAIKKDLREMKGDIRELRRDLNDHRSNTELHGTKKNRKVS